MTCFLFPGQPVAFGDLSAVDSNFRALCDRCCAVTGFNPLEQGTAPQLSDSVRLQLYGVCVSLDHLTRLLQQYGPPALISEHSMGIYPALVACGSIDVDAALELTWRIGTCLGQMGKRQQYVLGSVIGLDGEPLSRIVENTGVQIANYNTSRHFLLAGAKDRVSAALIEAEAHGAFSVSSFPCDAPLHTTLVREVVPQLAEIVASFSFREPVIGLVESFNQTLLTAESIPGFLVEELCQPVYWDRTYRQLRTRGATRFLEVGNGMSLTKFNRWIDSES